MIVRTVFLRWLIVDSMSRYRGLWRGKRMAIQTWEQIDKRGEELEKARFPYLVNNELLVFCFLP